jgi:HYR domain-containing protein
MRRLRRYGLAAFATLAVAAGIVELFPTGASSMPTRTLGTLELRATFRDTLNEESCPSGVPVPAQVECFRFDGDGVVPGLGKATVTWQLIDDLTDGLSCEHFNFTTIVVKVAGKGEIDASLTDPKTHCWTRPPVVAGPFGGTVIGGSGSYAGASGNLQVTENLTEESGGAGEAIETWVGTLTVPGLDFDLSPPTLHGVHDRTVRAGKARRVRVRFTVTAKDAARPAVLPVTCTPRSGSLFKRGRTNVTCSATDANGNTATATFAVTVKR